MRIIDTLLLALFIVLRRIAIAARGLLGLALASR